MNCLGESEQRNYKKKKIIKKLEVENIIFCMVGY